MSSRPDAGAPSQAPAGRPTARGGLRERKKARTRASIRQHALRLFREQGYSETTVEQIAEAAEVSPSTFFRYFPTKEDVVLRDDFDTLTVEAFKAQPPELTPLQAFRAATREVMGSLSAEDLGEMAELYALARSVPELRAALIDELTRTMRLVADLVAERAGRRRDDPAVRNVAGALIGVVLAATLLSDEDPFRISADDLDAALEHLEAGLPL